MPDCHLQSPFADIIVQRCSGHAQKERQRLPVPKHVSNARPQGRVGLHAMLVELLAKPGMEFLHDRTTVGLMQEQPLRRQEIPLLGERVVVIDHREQLQHVAALLGKPLRHIDELPSPVRQAIAQDRLQPARQVPRQGIAHLDWRGKVCRTLDQHVLEVLARHAGVR